MSSWIDMPENTEEEKLRKEIAECNYCINGLCNTMHSLRVPKKQWGENVMVKEYLRRIDIAREKLAALENEEDKEHE